MSHSVFCLSRKLFHYGNKASAESIAYNRNRKQGDLRFYEFGNCYFFDKEKKQEEIANKVKNGCEAIKKMLTIVKENDFINQYKEWKKSATELFNQFGDKIENKDQIKDPIQMMSSMCLALKKANEGGENKEG